MRRTPAAVLCTLVILAATAAAASPARAASKSYPAEAFLVTAEGTGSFSGQSSGGDPENGSTGTRQVSGTFDYFASWDDVWVPLVREPYYTKPQTTTLTHIKGTSTVSARDTTNDGTPVTYTGACSSSYTKNLPAAFNYDPLSSHAVDVNTAPPEVQAGDDAKCHGEDSVNPQFGFTDIYGTGGTYTPDNLDTGTPVSFDEIGRKSFRVHFAETRRFSSNPLDYHADPNCDDNALSIFIKHTTCSWKVSWSGYLTFQRVCSAAQGARVRYVDPEWDQNSRRQRYVILGSCPHRR